MNDLIARLDEMAPRLNEGRPHWTIERSGASWDVTIFTRSIDHPDVRVLHLVGGDKFGVITASNDDPELALREAVIRCESVMAHAVINPNILQDAA